MVWDIVIAAGIAFTQLVITWYGVHVSVAEHRIRNAFIIGGLGALGIGLTIYGVIRSSTAQIHLQTQLDTIQRNTEKPQPAPNVYVNPQVTIPQPSPHTHVEYLDITRSTALLNFPWRPDLRAGQKMTVPMEFINSGDFAVQEPKDAGIVVLVPIGDIDKASLSERRKFKFYGVNTDIPAHSTTGLYHTFESSEFTADDVNKINAGQIAVCGFGAVRWKDETGGYETGYAECFVVAPDHTSNWHTASGHNKERKLGSH